MHVMTDVIDTLFSGEGSSSGGGGGAGAGSGSTPNNQERSVNNEGGSGNEGGPPSTDRDGNPLEPFLALDESNRRLQGKAVVVVDVVSV